MKSIPKFHLAAALAATAIGGLAAGCSAYDVKLDSISRAVPAPAANRASYTVENRNPAIATDSLRYREAARHIKTALSGRGLWEAPNPSAAALVVALDYDIDPPPIVYKETEVPVYVPTCPAIGQMTGRQLVGHENTPAPTVVREQHLSVSCRENSAPPDGRPAPELWRIEASIEDEKTDLRECLPVLAAVVMNQIGTTTDGVATTRIGANDQAVAFIKKGL